MKAKYLETRPRAGGAVATIFNPPEYVKKLVPQAAYQAFDDRKAAEDHARKITAQYELARREQRQFAGNLQVAQFLETYRTSEEWTRLSENTRRAYLRGHTLLASTSAPGRSGVVGDLRVRTIDVPTAHKIYRAVRAATTESSASAMVRALRAAWSYMITEGEAVQNPWSDVRLPSQTKRKNLWTREQVNQLVYLAEERGHHAFALLITIAYHHCQRPGDVRKLPWGQIGTDTIAYLQEKTSEPVVLPITPGIRQRLNRLSRGGLTDPVIVNEANGKMFSDRDYNRVFEELREAANLPSDLQIRDLRRTGTTEMLEAGATDGQAMSVTGHRSRNMLDTYGVQSQSQAAQALEMRFGSHQQPLDVHTLAARLMSKGYMVPAEALQEAMEGLAT